MEIRDTVSNVFSWFSTGQLFSLKGCWITKEFRTEQTVTEYLWVWLAACLMAVLYTIMFVVMRGWFNIDGDGAGLPAETETEEDRESQAIANLMLL